MKPEEFKEAILKQIFKKRKNYAGDSDLIISDFNREVELTKEYNGRQILELLQNADDAESKEVSLKFETKERKLTIANKGEHPFTVDGIKSLMQANLSTKKGKKYIGNKGLGFRSILNWANRILIKTNGCLVEFSPKIAEEEFNDIYIDSETRVSLLKAQGLSEKAVPFPLLSIPRVDIEINPESEWTTIIEIYYKEDFEDKIKSQLEDCTEEILLFLNNIEKISIDGLASETHKFNRTKLNEAGLTFIQIQDKVWRVETLEDYLPEELQDKNKSERELYNITVAFQDNLSDTYYKLFNYFPTKLSVCLPCIIHATFELNSSRDYLNDSPKNVYILNKLVDLLKKTTLKLAAESEGNSNWNPFKLLLPIKSETDSKLIDDFYLNVKKLHDELAIFPCTDGLYEKFSNIKYYGNSFSDWVIKNGYNSYFPSLLIPLEREIAQSFPINNKIYQQVEFTPMVDAVSEYISELKTRAELISLMMTEEFRYNRGEKYSLLVNDKLVNNKNEVIKKTSVTITPIIESEGVFDKPDFVNIDFINKDLYRLLADQHKDKFDSKEPESREFQRHFKEIVNIQPYDSNNVISRIISGTRDKIKSVDKESATDAIKSMVQCLFKNYLSLKYKTDSFSESCPLISKEFEIQESNTLFLSSNYPSGIITESIYHGVLTDEYYLCDSDYYGIEHTDKNVIESFFIWLGVNKFVQFKDIVINKEQYEADQYFDFVFDYIAKPNPVSRFSFKGKQIGLFNETIAKLSNEKLICLILKEERINHALEFINSDALTYQYSNSYLMIQEKPSYIKFQLESLKRFNNYLIESNEIPFINDISVNYEDPIFKLYGLRDTPINEVLEKLGAHQSFVELDTEKVYELIFRCGKLKADYKHARKLYLNAFEHYKSNKDNFKGSPKSGTMLLAVKNEKKDYVNIDEEDVYYSDNSTLPEKITKDIWVFDFPKRVGENQVSNFFGIKTFKELRLTVEKGSQLNHDEAKSFDQWFSKIKPLILAYRISGLKQIQDKRNAANALKKCTIRLVSEVSYNMNAGSLQKLGFEELLVTEDQFIISAESFKRLENLKGSSKFCGAFAEIICILFEVNESKNNYISVFKDSFDFSRDVIKSDYLEENLIEAYSLLGLSQNEIAFWEAICKINSIEWQEVISDENQLKLFVKEKLNFDLQSSYRKIDFDSFSNSESFEFLKSLSENGKLTLTKLKEVHNAFPGLKEWHLGKLTDVSRGIEMMFAHSIWNNLAKEEQKYYLDKRNSFRKWFDHYPWSDSDLPPLIIEVDYFSFLKDKVKRELHIDLVENISPITIHLDYVELLAKYEEIEKSFSDNQKSLLFFSGNKDEITKIIESIIKPESELPAVEKTDETLLPIIETSLKNTTSLKSNGHGKRKSGGGGSFDPEKEKGKRKAGLKAEQKVRDKLLDLYGRKNVRWVSGNSDEDYTDDSLGFDVYYRRNELDEWLFLEVKSVSGNSFIVTDNELTVAFGNKDKYHLALVKSGQIFIDKEFFTNIELENDYKRLNSGLSIRPYDYEIYVDLKPEESNESTELIDSLTINSLK
jgi:hypothetical protein